MAAHETDLEAEIRMELEKLEQIFSEKVNDTDDSRPKLSYSVYEFADAEGEKEQMQDKLHLLLSKTEEFDTQLCEMTIINNELKAQNKSLEIDNQRLRCQLDALKATAVTKCGIDDPCAEAGTNADSGQSLKEMLTDMQSKLSRSEQAYDDICVAKDAAIKEFERERMLRIHIEKERDAYSAAYEASLNHFEKWTRAQHKATCNTKS